MDLLQNANAVALTGDHWTSVSNQNYLGVTAHHIDTDWKLHLFALTVRHTEERHFAETCAQHFSEVAEQWDVAGKVKTIGTDSARNMLSSKTPAIRAHAMHCAVYRGRSQCQSVTVISCCKLVGHFKHSPANAAEL